MATQIALPLDHLVINVHRELPAAHDLFARLGFTLTPMGRHTLGSINHLMVFGSDYIELIGLPREGATERSETLLKTPAGMDGLVFKTSDADRTHERLSALGVPLLPIQSFSRPVELDGVNTDARFRTVRFESGHFPAGRVYFCQHYTPELVWRKEWQKHACRVRGISALLIVSTHPEADARRYALACRGEIRRGPHGEFRIEGAAYALVVVSPQDYRSCFGDLACEAHGRSSFFGAIALRVRTLAPLRRILETLESEPLGGARASAPPADAKPQPEYIFRDRGDRIAVSIPGVATLLEFLEEPPLPST